MSDVLIRVADLELDYGGDFALRVPELDVLRHQTLTLIGHNGSGKSSLLRVLSLLMTPSAGTIHFDGERVPPGAAQQLRFRRRMASVLQQPYLCRMSVFRNVALGLRFQGVAKQDVESRVMTWLERLRIDHLRDRDARRLSGGEAQRTSIARAMVLEPDVLFLDEPFSALDPPTRHGLIDEFQQILGATRTTTVFATHDRGEALALSDRIAVVQRGELAQCGSAEEIFTRPASEEVARFVGAATLIPGRISHVTDGLLHIDAEAGRLAILGEGDVGERVTVCVRPEDVTLSPGGEAASTSARNLLRGSIQRIVPADATYRVVVGCGVPVVASVTGSALRELQLEVGSEVVASFKATAAHTIRRSAGPDRHASGSTQGGSAATRRE